MPQWRLQHGGSYLVTGEPVIVSDLTSSITHSIELLLVAVLLVMAATLGLIFPGRPRLLPLALALLAAALTFGALSLRGRLADDGLDRGAAGARRARGRLRDPVPVARREEARARTGAPSRPRRVARSAPRRRRRRRSRRPGAASAAAMLVLLLSPVPMVRGFGVLLVVGVAIALLCALTAGAAALVARAAAGRGARAPRPAPRTRVPGAVGRLAAAWRGARELLRDNPLTRCVSRAALVGAVRQPGRVLGVGLALAALGWGLDTQTHVETDITKLVPQNLSSLQSLNALERDDGRGRRNRPDGQRATT